MIAETEWAYLAGMIDGEGHIGIIRHSKVDCSKRGYEIETILTISCMNEDDLSQLQMAIGMGKIVHVRHDRECGRLHVGSLRFNVGEQRIILTHILPYIKQKKTQTQIVKALLNYRETHRYDNGVEKEQAYYQFEKLFEEATIKAKPWLLLSPMRKRGKPHKPVIPPLILITNTTTGEDKQ